METETRYNYYDILEVSPHCTQHELTTAYERARTTYSGANPALYTMFNEHEARELLKLVEEAYSVLGNKTLRALYDEKLGKGVKNTDLSFESLLAESKTLFNSGQKKGTFIQPIYKMDEALEKEFHSKTEWSGTDLRQAREYKNLTLERVSEVTRISPFYINALELFEPQNLPAPVFVRGYVVQLAKLLGLNEKVVADSYMKKFKSFLEKK